MLSKKEEKKKSRRYLHLVPANMYEQNAILTFKPRVHISEYVRLRVLYMYGLQVQLVVAGGQR